MDAGRAGGISGSGGRRIGGGGGGGGFQEVSEHADYCIEFQESTVDALFSISCNSVLLAVRIHVGLA